MTIRKQASSVAELAPAARAVPRLMTNGRRSKMVMRGHLVEHLGQLWVVTGYCRRKLMVYIACDAALKGVHASEVDMHWTGLDQ